MLNHEKTPEPVSRRVKNRLNKAIPFYIVEAYKNIRTGLLFSLATSEKKSIVVSSADPGTGKSTTCSNLAITMAQTGAKVILLDADLRKPVQHKIFQKTNTIGISELLSGFAQMNEVMHENVVENLDLITSGAIPPNPSELLGSNNMAQLLDALHEHYDYIFIDTPPINVVADALLLSGKTAGTLLVARQLRTTYDELKKAIESIQQVNGNILGSVITDVKEHDKPYSNYRKYKTYDYQYGRL